jgi:aspartate racemase
VSGHLADAIVSTTPPLAIIGGMGPLASAEFVRTVYERAAGAVEQQLPRLLLWSDPSFPDRTLQLLDSRPEMLAAPLRHAVEQCCRLGAEEIVICCMTIHAVVPLLPMDMQRRIASLVEVALATVIERQTPQLLLATTGARTARVLERHPLWPEASRWLRWPDDEDQQRVHRAIYAIKQNRGVNETIRLVGALLEKYTVPSFVAACTELHLVHRQLESPAHCIDPLDLIATRILAGSIRHEALL